MRTNNNGEVSYSSFQELAAAWNIKPVSKVTKDKEKLKSQQDKFVSKHICKGCGQPMTFNKGTNIMVCSNPECKGIKMTRENEDGTKSVYYLTSYSLLDELGEEIAENIFSVEV